MKSKDVATIAQAKTACPLVERLIQSMPEIHKLTIGDRCIEIAHYPIPTHQSSDDHNCFNYSQGSNHQ